MGEEKGSIAFFSTYRPPVPLDIFASPINPESDEDEFLLTDGKSYNYNGREIPPGALKTLLKNTRMGERAGERDVDNGDVTGLVFVSERTSNLETLHFALRFERRGRVKVYNFGELYDTDMSMDARMEDSGCFAGNRYFIFISTHERNERRQPWNAVYRTDLRNGETMRLTPDGVADFSPSVSPSGRKIAVATLEEKPGGWDGEIEDLKTDIAIIDVEDPEAREMALQNGGWPSWGSNGVIFFHRAQVKPSPPNTSAILYNWGVFRADIRDGFVEEEDVERVTPENVDAMTPAAIDRYQVAVAIIREKLDVAAPRDRPQHYRHVAVFDTRRDRPQPVTRRTNNYADHYNPFVIKDTSTGEVLIGYNRIIGEELERGEVADQVDTLEGDDPDEVGVVRVPGVFPTFTGDGTKLAFVDNDFQNLYLADDEGGLRPIFSVSDLELPENGRALFSPVWNQDDEKDILYVCVGPAFSADKQVHIYAIFNASDDARRRWRKLTNDGSNNAFPSTDPEGNKLVFRSTRDWVRKSYRSPVRPKNLYIMDASRGDREEITRLTSGDCVDTHCQWSPNGNWIVYSSTRDKPTRDNSVPPLDNGLDPGYYSIYLIRADRPNSRPVRVISSGSLGAGHVNHPMFSPNGDSLVFASDLAGVSVEPISLPLFIHSVRPYGDIFRVDLNDTENISANEDITEYTRVTHSRYENSTPHWTCLTTDELNDGWRELFRECEEVTWSCPFSDPHDRSWKANAALAGQLGLLKRCC